MSRSLKQRLRHRHRHRGRHRRHCLHHCRRPQEEERNTYEDVLQLGMRNLLALVISPKKCKRGQTTNQHHRGSRRNTADRDIPHAHSLGQRKWHVKQSLDKQATTECHILDRLLPRRNAIQSLLHPDKNTNIDIDHRWKYTSLCFNRQEKNFFFFYS
jgi:hypothetical protein